MADLGAAGLNARVVRGAVLVDVPESALADTVQRAEFAAELAPFVRRSRATLLVPDRSLAINASGDRIEQLRNQLQSRSGSRVRPHIYEPAAPIPEASTGIEVVLIPR